MSNAKDQMEDGSLSPEPAQIARSGYEALDKPWYLGASVGMPGYAYTKNEPAIGQRIRDRMTHLRILHLGIQNKLNIGHDESNRYRTTRKGWLSEDFPKDLSIEDVFILVAGEYYYGGSITINQDRTFVVEKMND